VGADEIGMRCDPWIFVNRTEALEGEQVSYKALGILSLSCLKAIEASLDESRGIKLPIIAVGDSKIYLSLKSETVERLEDKPKGMVEVPLPDDMVEAGLASELGVLARVP